MLLQLRIDAFFWPRRRFEHQNGIGTRSNRANALDAKILRFTAISHFWIRNDAEARRVTTYFAGTGECAM